MLASSVFAGSDNKDTVKSKRAFSLGYGYQPYSYFDHDLIDHAPIAAVHHSPVTTVHHAPYVTHTQVVDASPLVSAVAPVSRVTSSIVSTNVHHYPASYLSPPAQYLSASPYYDAYHAPAAVVASPAYLTAYHRR